jgi:hypothetical protein
MKRAAKIRVPSSTDLYELPALGSLLLLETATVVAANALRAQHVQLEADFHPGEPEDATTARILARECVMLRDTLVEYRRRVLARLARERSDWPS